MLLNDLTSFFDSTLDLKSFCADSSNNGLQIEGVPEVKKVVFAVDACQASVDFAAANQAQMLVVHHGLSWGGNPRRWTGIEAKRFGTFFRNGISLYAAHLPLDAHPSLGNNAVLCSLADVTKDVKPCFHYDGVDIGFCGKFSKEISFGELTGKLENALNCRATVLGDPAKLLTSAAVVSGGGGMEALMDAKARNCDVLITGELDHVMYHYAIEADVAVLALGHYASETTGVRALMGAVSKRFPVETIFADIPTGF